MTNSFRLTLLWIVGSMLAFFVAMNFMPAAFVDGHYIPVSNDSFYHARRILDAVNFGAIYQFDSHIHFPEGSWITWPWGYDYLMAKITKAGLWLFGPRDPMSILAYIPVAAIPLTIALLVAITGVLELSMPLRVLVVLTTGISALTQTLHGVGVIDHHFMEHILILCSVLLSVRWLRDPQNALWAAILGAVLGVSVAFHNGLFILQLPLLTTLGFLWLCGHKPQPHAAAWFAIGLMCATAAVAIPSEALWHGAFDFYLLSWFHLYVSCCTSFLVLLFAQWEPQRRQWLFAGAIALALLAPIAGNAGLGGAFVTGKLDLIQHIDEVNSPYALATTRDGVARISRLYGLYIWLAPVLLAVCFVQIFRERRAQFVYFWIFGTFSLLLLISQMRFHYFGSLALYLVPFLGLEKARQLWTHRSTVLLIASSVLAMIALLPTIKLHLSERPHTALDSYYETTRGLYSVLAKACRTSPGVVLAGADQGHYVRYHTNCSVIANNFLLTPQHAEKLTRVNSLYALTPQALLEAAPEVRYVIVTLKGYFERQTDGTYEITPTETLRQKNKPLDYALLLTDKEQLPHQYRLLQELRLDKEFPHPIARLFEILPAYVQREGRPL